MPNLFTELKRPLLLSIPIIIGQFGQLSIHIIDSMMIGILGVKLLAASSLVGNFLNLFLIIGLGMGIAIRIFVSQAKDSKKDQMRILKHAIFCALGYGIIVSILSQKGYFLLHLLGFPSSILMDGMDYVKFLSLSLIPGTIFIVLKAYFESIKHPYIPLIILLGSVLLNISFNWVLIYGNLGFPCLGIKGAGIATLLARMIALLSLILCVIYLKFFKIKVSIKSLCFLEKKIFLNFLNVSLESSLQQFLGWGSFIFITFMVGKIGIIAIAAHQIASYCSSIPYMIILGFSFAITIYVGENFGKNNFKRIRKIAYQANIFACALMILSSIVIILFRNLISLLFVKDFQVLQLTSKLLVLVGGYLFFLSFQITTLGVLRGLKDLKIPASLLFFGYWIVGVVLAYILSFHLNLNVMGIWIGLSLGMSVSAIFLLVRFTYLIKQKEITLGEISNQNDEFMKIR